MNPNTSRQTMKKGFS